jgi:CheY-like chemotaxis protein
VLVTDIRMPPTFQREGIDAAKEVRKRHPGTGIVVLSQYEDPEYAISLLAEGSAGYGYLLKDHVAEGNSSPTRSGRWRPVAPRLTRRSWKRSSGRSSPPAG